MPNRPPRFKPIGAPAKKLDRRPSAHRRGYGRRWQKARTGYLKQHPLCVECKARGRLTLATVVDHIVPHKGDMAIFWDSTNWQPLCARHHNEKTVREDGGLGREVKPKLQELF